MQRRHLEATLAAFPERPLDAAVRPVTESDAEALATLMLDAYRGTIDFEGTETLDTARDGVASFLGGDPLLDASLAAVAGEPPRIVSTVLVARHGGRPFVAYAYTDPAYKGRGLSSELLRRAMTALHRAGETGIHLWVTVGNVPAEGIYERLGFTDASAVE